MKRDRFKYIWRHISFVPDNDDDDAESDNEGETMPIPTETDIPGNTDEIESSNEIVYDTENIQCDTSLDINDIYLSNTWFAKYRLS